MSNTTVQELAHDQVQVWYADLDLATAQISTLFSLLSMDEQIRADRFHFARDRSCFIAARGILRKILSQYTRLAPAQLQFVYNEYGKPSLLQVPQLNFNLSHAHTKVVYAFTYAPAVGIDIEYTEKDLDIEGIAERFFAANEYQLLKTLSPIEKRQAFFTGWVRKEAFLKALGIGLSYSLANVEVSLLPDQPTQIIALHDGQQNVAEWSLFTLTPGEGYLGAMVVKGQSIKLSSCIFSSNNDIAKNL